jgi:hypothetical protein
MLSQEPDMPEKQEYSRKLRDTINPSQTNLTTWANI